MADNFTDTFTKEETIKALRCCYSDEGLCSICPYEDTITSCTQLLKRDAFDIIKSQEQFIESQNKLISKLALECKNNISNEAKVKHGEWMRLPALSRTRLALRIFKRTSASNLKI